MLSPETKAHEVLRRVVKPDFAIGAVAPDGRLVGVAGFKTAEGAFMDGDLTDLRAEFGAIGGLWRGVALSLLERPVVPGTLLMNGIIIEVSARGQGTGQALLEAIKGTARMRGCRDVRLDVIDTNPRARALYEREGVVPGETTHLGPLRHVFGFRRATTMS